MCIRLQSIVMSNEFETLDQPLMVEIIRRRQMPHVRAPVEPHFDTTGKKNIAHLL